MRPSLWRLRPDFFTLKALPQLVKAYRGGDNHLLSSVGKLIERHGGSKALAKPIRQTHVRHILIKVNELVPEGEAKRKIVGLKERLDHGADFVSVGMYDFQIKDNCETVKLAVERNQKRARPWYA